MLHIHVNLGRQVAATNDCGQQLGWYMHEKSFPMGQMNRMGDLKLAGKPDVVTAGFPPQGDVGRAAIASLMRALLSENNPATSDEEKGRPKIKSSKSKGGEGAAGGRRIDVGGGVTIRDDGGRGGVVTDADRAALGLARELLLPGPGVLGDDAPAPRQASATRGHPRTPTEDTILIVMCPSHFALY